LQNLRIDVWNAEHCSASCGKIRRSVPSNARRSGFAKTVRHALHSNAENAATVQPAKP
jgi:hypothetical protein